MLFKAVYLHIHFQEHNFLSSKLPQEKNMWFYYEPNSLGLSCHNYQKFLTAKNTHSADFLAGI